MDEDQHLNSAVSAFVRFVSIFAVAAMSLLVGYHFGKGTDKSAGYVARCQTMRQHAIIDSESPALTKAIILTVDYIEQVKTPGFHGELP